MIGSENIFTILSKETKKVQRVTPYVVFLLDLQHHLAVPLALLVVEAPLSRHLSNVPISTSTLL